MAKLHSIIGAIMRDIIAAQHEANLYSLSLSENYGSEGRARDLQLPGVQFGEIEMDLKYGIKGSDLDEESNIRLGELGGFISKLCQRAADISIKVLASHMTGWNISNKLKFGEDWRDFFADIAKEGDSVKEYSLFLSRAMNDAFYGSIHRIVDNNSGQLVNDMIVEQMMSTFEKEILDGEKIQKILSSPNGAEHREKIMSSVREALAETIAEESIDQNFRRSKNYLQLDVAVTAEELEKMPETAIHNFKFRFAPTTHNVADSAKNNGCNLC